MPTSLSSAVLHNSSDAVAAAAAKCGMQVRAQAPFRNIPGQERYVMHSKLHKGEPSNSAKGVSILVCQVCFAVLAILAANKGKHGSGQDTSYKVAECWCRQSYQRQRRVGRLSSVVPAAGGKYMMHQGPCSLCV